MISHGVEISIAGGGADEKDDRTVPPDGYLCSPRSYRKNKQTKGYKEQFRLMLAHRKLPKTWVEFR